MQREEKVLDVALEAIIQRVVDIKNSLQSLLDKLSMQGENADWPQYLDHFSVISAQIYSLLKVIKNEKTPILRNFVTLPLLLNAETDEHLLQVTEQRVPSFSHDFVPNLLRTKPEPEVENKMNALEHKTMQTNSEIATKSIMAHNKVIKHALDLLNHAREEWDTDPTSRLNQPQNTSTTETALLAAAIACGKNLKHNPVRTQAPPPPISSQPPPTMSTAKAPSSIKTNIKSAGQMNHPYNR